MTAFTVPGNPAPQAAIDVGAFWPEIDPEHARKAMKLDGSVSNERLRAALVAAAADVVSQCLAWQSTQLAAGYSELAAVPAPSIDGESLKLHHFRRAVYALATASLTERLRSIDTTRAGIQAAGVLEEPIDTLMRDARHALNDLRGLPRATIELI